MGWAVGYSDNWRRDIGYGVPSICDHPDCSEKIDRGLSYLCGHIHNDDIGCGLYFCSKHRPGYMTIDGDSGPVCERCDSMAEPFEAKPDTPRWTEWKMRHPSWAKWRAENSHPEPSNPLNEDADDIEVKEPT